MSHDASLNFRLQRRHGSITTPETRTESLENPGFGRVFTDHMRSVVQGAKLGLSECRWQFRFHHWNCSSPPTGQEEKPPSLVSEFKGHRPGGSFTLERKETPSGKKRSVNSYTSNESSDNKWNSVLKHGSKEVAYAHAVWSAAVTHAVARSCRDGSLTSCSCGKTTRPPDLKNEWRWGGCGDNLQYGYKFAADFVDSREKEKFTDRKASAKALVNLHNNEAGRRAVLKKTKIACKCHGVSGSCALVTCWHQVPSFRDIGDTLKERYAEATLVKMNRRGRLQVKRSGDKIPSVHDLVYVENSPNYCIHNETLGVPGPSGRICNRTSNGPDGCKALCCNKGFSTSVVKKATRCQCKFIWCCQVVCQECKKVQKISACK